MRFDQQTCDHQASLYSFYCTKCGLHLGKTNLPCKHARVGYCKQCQEEKLKLELTCVINEALGYALGDVLYETTATAKKMTERILQNNSLNITMKCNHQWKHNICVHCGKTQNSTTELLEELKALVRLNADLLKKLEISVE